MLFWYLEITLWVVWVLICFNYESVWGCGVRSVVEFEKHEVGVSLFVGVGSCWSVLSS